MYGSKKQNWQEIRHHQNSKKHTRKKLKKYDDMLAKVDSTQPRKQVAISK